MSYRNMSSCSNDHRRILQLNLIRKESNSKKTSYTSVARPSLLSIYAESSSIRSPQVVLSIQQRSLLSVVETKSDCKALVGAGTFNKLKKYLRASERVDAFLNYSDRFRKFDSGQPENT